MNMNPYLKYQENAVNTASPLQVIIMLYDGVIRFTKQSQIEMKEQRYDSANNYSLKAQAIVNELIASLNYDYKIANELLSIYEYVLHLLIQGNLKKDNHMYDEVIDHMNQLRESWKEINKKILADEKVSQ